MPLINRTCQVKGTMMVNNAERILLQVSQAPGCLLEEIVLASPDLTRSQVFLEVDALSRSGRLQVTNEGLGIYTLRIPT